MKRFWNAVRMSLALACLGMIVVRGVAADSERLAPPTKEAREAAETVVQELFGDEIEKASRGAADVKLALVKKLIKQAGETTDDAAARFVIYQKARDLAAAAGDVTNCMAAIDKLAEQYAIDPAGDRFAALTGLAKNAKSQDAVQAILDAALPSIDEAIAADDFDAAGKLVRFASSLATRLRNTQVVSQLKSRPPEIEQLKKEFAKVADAETKLASEPDNAAANQTVGFYRGPMKGDFKTALESLAKGTDPVLKELAKKELAGPTEAADQGKLADGWWDAAEHQREPAKAHLQAHAVEFYRRAAPSLKGLAKAQAESRIKTFENERPTPLSTLRSAVLKVVCDGDWRIKWFTSTTEYGGPVSSEYPVFFFKPDGTTTHVQLKWHFIDKTATIEVSDARPGNPFIQRFMLVGDKLKCENYNPPDTLRNLGIGTKNPPH